MSTQAPEDTGHEQDYIPGTKVIRNLIGRDDESPYGTSDQAVLNRAETFYVSDRIAQLLESPLPATFTFAHMRSIHRHLFQDVYAWAGDPRRVPMTKRGTAYAAPRDMNAMLRGAFARLAARDHLRGVPDRSQFARELAESWAEINHAHAFREGNTRSQVLFFMQLAEHAGWQVDLARLSPHHRRSVYHDFISARFEYQHLRATSVSSSAASIGLAEVLFKITGPDRTPQGALLRAADGAVNHAPEAAGNADTLREHYDRFPELRPQHDDDRASAGGDYQP